MKILIVGLGSMGKRRIRLIKRMYPCYELIGIDLNGDRRQHCTNEYGIVTYCGLEQVFLEHTLDCAFVCTSPLSHSEIISICLKNGINVFTEINLVSDGYYENLELAKKMGKVLFLSSTMLYRKEIKAIKEHVKNCSCTISYIYHVGQYLPDWHPWESYEDYFVSDMRTNACREIFAIEIPWLIDTFGEVVECKTTKGKISDLKLSYSDNYFVVLEHANGNKGLFAVDVVSRSPVRNIEVYGQNIYLKWNGRFDGLKILNLETNMLDSIGLYREVDQLSQYNQLIVEDAYSEEIATFFSMVSGIKLVTYGFESDERTLKLIDLIEG